MRYPSPIDTPTQIGETTSYFGMEMTCTGKSIDSIKNTCAKYGMEIPPEYYKYGMSLEDLNICNISITFQNNSSETQSTYPYFFIWFPVFGKIQLDQNCIVGLTTQIN